MRAKKNKSSHAKIFENISHTLNAAMQYHNSGHFDEAAKLYRQILQIQPQNADALHLLGVIAAQKNDNVIAEKLIRQAIAIKPNQADYYTNLGNVLQAQGHIEQAIQYHQKALEMMPVNQRTFHAYNNLGVCFHEIYQWQQAINCYQHALKLAPMNAQTHHNLANSLHEQNKFEAAIHHYKMAIKIQPNFVDAYASLSSALRCNQNLDEALYACQCALKLQPDHIVSQINLTAIFLDKEEYPLAIEWLEKVWLIAPDKADIYRNIALIAFRLDEISQSTPGIVQTMALSERQELLNQLNEFSKKIALHFGSDEYQLGSQPDRFRLLNLAIRYNEKSIYFKKNDVKAYFSIGNIFRYLGKYYEAKEAYRQGLLFAPDHIEMRFSSSTLSLEIGEFSNSWTGWECRPDRLKKIEKGTIKDLINIVKPLPYDLTGKTCLIYREQGLGDELLFLRFVSLLKKRGAKIIYQCGSKLKNLLSRHTEYLDQVINEGDVQHLHIQADYTLLVGDLPQALDFTDPPPPPFPLSPLPEQVKKIRQQLNELGKPPYVGIAWQGGGRANELKQGEKRLYKEIPLPLLADIIHPIEGTLLILQRNPQQNEIDTLTDLLKRPLHNFSALNDDLEAMLALLYCLDEYISVSNTNMHLLAGLGKTAKVLIPYPPDWRWMVSGESLWFKEFTTYRQAVDGSWDAVLSDFNIKN